MLLSFVLDSHLSANSFLLSNTELQMGTILYLQLQMFYLLLKQGTFTLLL
jgi:hypothetical protein